jgi:hypothetical protein
VSSGLSNQFAGRYKQTKSQQRVGLLPHSFLLLESATRDDYPQAPIQRRLWLPSCRNGNTVRTTVSPADGSLWSSVGNRISSNFATPDAGGITIRMRNSSMRCAKCCIFVTNGRGLPAYRLASNRVPTKHQTKRSTQARCRRTRGKAVVAQRAWAAAARVGDFGRRSRASLTRWT